MIKIYTQFVVFLFIVLMYIPANGQMLPTETDTHKVDSLRMRLVGASASSVEIPDYKESILLPQAALMNMYGDYPVDLANGLVNISVPLYEIKTAHLSLPVNAKFHASGLKADEQEGLLGLRWLLDATYSVNRKTKGYPDDGYVSWGKFGFDNRVNNVSYIPDLSTLYGTTAKQGITTEYAIPSRSLHLLTKYSGPASKYMDTEYDIFSYHLPSGKSGKFILKDINGVKIPCTLPYEPIRIEMGRRYNPNGEIHQFTITDENGIAYNYGRTIHLPEAKLNLEYTGWGSGTLHISEWKLNAIISADKQDTILFEYDKRLFIRHRIKGYNIWNKRNMFYLNQRSLPSSGPIVDFYHDEINYTVNKDNVDTTIPYQDTCDNLSKITFKGGQILFDYSEIASRRYCLSSMRILDASSALVKSINFSYRKETSSLILLDKLSLNDSQNISKGTYKFNYYNTNLYSANNSDYDIQSDWWGYYNREGCNVLWEDSIRVQTHTFYSPISTTKLVSVGYKNKNKNANLEYMKTGMIESVEYPTGGKTVYDYETNYYIKSGSTRPLACGGLRIKSIKSISVDGKSDVKTYKYNPSTNTALNGGGFMPVYFQPPRERGGSSRWRNFIEQEGIHATCGPFANWPIPIGIVGSFSASYVKTIYSNLIPGQFTDFHSNMVYYDKVTEYQGTEQVNTGWTEHSFYRNRPLYTEYPRNSISDDITNSERQYIHVLPAKFGENSRLSGKTVYDNNNRIIKEIIYNYTGFDKGKLYDLPVKRLMRLRVGEIGTYRIEDIDLTWADGNIDEVFTYINQEYTLGASRLTKETVKTYTPQGQVTVIKDIEYDPTYLLPVKETVSSSITGETKSVTYKYPFQSTIRPYIRMTSNNLLSPVIEKNIYKNGSFLEKGVTDYQEWAANVYAPMYFRYQKQGGILETRIEYDYNIRGQLRFAVKDGVQKAVYIRNGLSQPLAVIENATYGEVSSILGTAFIDRLSKSLTVGTSDMNSLNQLRSRLPLALVTTYTYKPLVGVLSVTDPRGVITKYEYDTFGRLQLTKDNTDKVLQRYYYNYKNQ